MVVIYYLPTKNVPGPLTTAPGTEQEIRWVPPLLLTYYYTGLAALTQGGHQASSLSNETNGDKK